VCVCVRVTIRCTCKIWPASFVAYSYINLASSSPPVFVVTYTGRLRAKVHTSVAPCRRRRATAQPRPQWSTSSLRARCPSRPPPSRSIKRCSRRACNPAPRPPARLPRGPPPKSAQCLRSCRTPRRPRTAIARIRPTKSSIAYLRRIRQPNARLSKVLRRIRRVHSCVKRWIRTLIARIAPVSNLPTLHVRSRCPQRRRHAGEQTDAPGTSFATPATARVEATRGTGRVRLCSGSESATNARHEPHLPRWLSSGNYGDYQRDDRAPYVRVQIVVRVREEKVPTCKLHAIRSVNRPA